MTKHDPLGIAALQHEVARLATLVETLVEDKRDRVYTVQEAAKAWNKSERTIHRYIAEGRLPVIRHGRTPMISHDTLTQGVPQSRTL